MSTSKPHGENKPLSETQLEQLRGFRIVVIYDADPTGREWREKDVAQLKASGIAAVALADLGATGKYDLGDFIDDRRSSGSSDEDIANAIHAMISEAWRGKKLDLPRATLSIAAPFPVEALPEVARVTTLAIAGRAQVDLAMSACAVLAVGCLAVQHLYDVEVYESLREPDWVSRMPRKQPLSLAVVAVAGPSERKTTTLAAAHEGVRQHEHNLTENYRAAQQAWENECALYKQAHRRILDNPQLLDDQKRDQLTDLGPPPLAPPPPTITPPDPTIEATIDLMSSAVPTLGLISAEGAIFLGGYSMNQDRIARSVAMLSKLVDGEGHVDLRRKGNVVVAPSARLCLCLFLQPEVVDDVLFGAALENQGLTSRLLIAFPAPKAGTRFSGTSEPWVRQAISRWASLTQQLVSMPVPQERPVIRISSEAMALLDQLYNEVESELGPGGSLERYRTFAGKICAHVVRVAAVLQVLEHAGNSGGLLSADSVRAGWEVARWFLDERRRIATEVTSNQEIERLDRLAAWLSQWRKDCELISPCEVQQRANRWLRSTYSSMPGRQAMNILADLEELETRGFLRGLEGSHVIAEPDREPVRRVKNVFQIVGYTDR
ncbi:MAG: DUF3987 domain-containing protein [Thermoanaerobaculia bacterium]|nr:DUF3987 domain-containing protein [Thermoanaerobaculia bacterium]